MARMDIRTDVAFQAIRDEIKPDKSDELDNYLVELKRLAVRGETLVVAMREAYEARSRYLLLVAEKKAKCTSMKEIETMYNSVLADRSKDALAWMLLQHRLQLELSQRQRVVFNMLHQGVLALLYQSNNVKFQKDNLSFRKLSPALSGKEMSDQWADFKKTTVDTAQDQNDELKVGANDGLPLGWRNILVSEYQIPFQIPPSLRDLKNKCRARMTGIYATFNGFKCFDGTAIALKDTRYSIFLGPWMLDRAMPFPRAKSLEATMVQYCMEMVQIEKKGKDGNLLDRDNKFAKRAVCCTGKISFDKSTVQDRNWDLSSIQDIVLYIEYDTLLFAAESS